MGRLSNGPITDPPRPLTFQTGSLGSPFELQPNVWRKPVNMSIEHTHTENTWTPKLQISERSSMTRCCVGERPAHHCGDDLVDFVQRPHLVES